MTTTFSMAESLTSYLTLGPKAWLGKSLVQVKIPVVPKRSVLLWSVRIGLVPIITSYAAWPLCHY